MIGSGLEMGETELEEGEALNFQNEAQDFTVDPDIALSYIDEKLQNVLGHFQKDFEGGVSAENLGAKFGGYGSFLPTYQRSPTWSHTKCQPEAHHNYDSPRSPKKLHVEDQRQNLLVSSSPSPSARSRIASGSSLKGNTSCLQSRYAEQTSLRSVDVKKSVNSSDQGTLKVRIKVGSKSLSTQKNAEIYSGLGLGVSSSSSLDDSPTTTEVQFGKLKEALEASPTSILQIMTSSPGGLILSPLSEDLICLTEKKKTRERVETKRVGKTCVESSGMLENGSFFSKSNKKKSKLSDKGGIFSVELTNQKNNGNNKSVQDVGEVEKSRRKLGSLSRSSEFKRESLVSNNAACPAVDQSESVSSGKKCEEGKPALEKSFTVGKKKSKMACTMGTQGASMSKVAFQALHKDPEKPGNRYRDFFGDTEFEDEDKESFSGEMKIPGRLKCPLVVGKITSIEDHNMLEEKLCLKFSQKTREAQENYPAAYQSAPPNGNGLSSEAPVGSVPLVQEDWVSCDKCQKWRLLPLGTNVSCLPDKWLCRMLTWLPGMNRCSVPQEETTNALRALYHSSASIPCPTSEIQHSQLNNNSAVNSANMASVDTYPSQENQNPASKILSRKRKHGLAKAAISSDRDDSNSFNSRRTSLGPSPLTNSLNSGKSLRSRLSGFAVKNFNDHKTETSSVFNSSDRGTCVKIKTKQEADISGSRAFKKMKGEGLHVGDNYWTSDSCGMTSKAGLPTTIFSYDTSEIDKCKSNHHKDLSQPKKDVLPGTNEETHVPGTLVNGLLFSEKSDYKDSLGKRKATDARDQRKEKKTRISKSGGKDINGRKTTLNPSIATNSSSSMVSSLHQTKIIGQEVKGVLSGEDGREMGKKDAAPFSDKQYKVEEKVVQSLKKSGKGLSSHSKGKAHTSGSVLDGLHNSSRTPGKGEKFTGQKDSTGGTSSESCKGQKQKKLAYNEKYINKSHDKKHPIHQEHYNEKLPKRSNQAEANGNGTSHSLLAMARISTEPVSGTAKENIVESAAFELDNDDGQEAPNHRKKSESLNCYPVRHPTPKSHKARDIDVPSPIRRESSSYAGNSALKEASALKHMADRLKNFGSTESVGLYLQAAIKFLHGASLMETGSSEATEQNELMHSMHIYSSTARLCEFCAHEYEKLKNMVATALAYKCMEVAYLHVVYLSHNSSSKDLNELQRALQIVPPGESPSSSASDVDNLNHQATTDKAALAKVVDSSPVSGSHILAARNSSGFLRILNFTRDVNLAMEASRRSKIALTAASEKLSESSDKEILDSLKRALDFSFHDIEGFLCLVRLAMESINR